MRHLKVSALSSSIVALCSVKERLNSLEPGATAWVQVLCAGSSTTLIEVQVGPGYDVDANTLVDGVIIALSNLLEKEVQT